MNEQNISYLTKDIAHFTANDAALYSSFLRLTKAGFAKKGG